MFLTLLTPGLIKCNITRLDDLKQCELVMADSLQTFKRDYDANIIDSWMVGIQKTFNISSPKILYPQAPFLKLEESRAKRLIAMSVEFLAGKENHK